MKFLRLWIAVGCLVGAEARSQDIAREASDWKPQIPRVWDDAAIASLELPLPSLEHTPKHVPSSYFEAIPTRTIWKSYPVYHPDREPEGYWEWLHEQEPQVAFDPERLKTKADWIEAGERVFRQGGDYSTGSELRLVRTREAFETIGIRVTADGELPYARYVVREKGIVELDQSSCASCHMRVLPDGSLLLGGPGDIPLGPMLVFEMCQELREGIDDVPITRDDIDYRFAAVPWLTPDPGDFAVGMSGEELARVFDRLPPGVFVRQRTSYLHPVRTPDLIGVGRRRFLDATGLVHQRSLVDLMRYAALNEGVDELASYNGFRPAADDGKTLPDPKTWVRSSDAQLYALALYLDSLQPPPNPNPFDESARRGRILFEREGCGRCHSGLDYSNQKLVPADGFAPRKEHVERGWVTDVHVGTDPGLTLRTRRGTGYYKIPSLRGVWYRGPFFHDGSLAALEDVFDPRRLEDDYMPTGFRGPKGGQSKRPRARVRVGSLRE